MQEKLGFFVQSFVGKYKMSTLFGQSAGGVARSGLPSQAGTRDWAKWLGRKAEGAEVLPF